MNHPHNQSEKIILGIDPGTNILGYGVIYAKNTNIKLIDYGAIYLTGDTLGKLSCIYDEICELIQNYKPAELATEAPFFGKNAQSMLKLGRAQGVAIAAALKHNLKVFEYAPKKIKLSITGRGFASKEQVAAMLKQIFSMNKVDGPLDATDALAVAVCHSFQHNAPQAGKQGGNNWKSFIKNNPDRVKG